MSENDMTQLDWRIDRAIDELNSERPPVVFEDDDREFTNLVDTARMVRRLREPAWPEDDFADVLAGSLEQRLVSPVPPDHHPLLNGRATLVETPALVKPRRLMTLRLIAAAMIRTIGVGVLAGMFAGIVAGGIGGRMVMCISAMLYLRERPNAIAITESSGRQVGTFTLGGTVELLVQGALMGLAGGLAYIVVRRWLPQSTRLRGVTFGLVLLVILGATVIDGNNQDFHRFGPPALNVAMFASIFILFGAVVAPVAERIESWLPPIDAREHSGKRGVPHMLARLVTTLMVYGSGVLGLIVTSLILTFTMLEVIAVVARITGILPADGDIPTVNHILVVIAVFVLAVVAPVASAAYSQAGKNLAAHGPGSIARPLALLHRRDATIAVQALLALGLVICVGLTLRAVVMILTATN